MELPEKNKIINAVISYTFCFMQKSHFSLTTDVRVVDNHLIYICEIYRPGGKIAISSKTNFFIANLESLF